MLCIFLLNYSISQDDLLQSDNSEIVLLRRACIPQAAVQLAIEFIEEIMCVVEVGRVGTGRLTNNKGIYGLIQCSLMRSF